jgi:RNA polymerase sigma-70 factor (ECF subfamily)
MKTTSQTLLQQIQAGSAEAWTRLDELYRPFIRAWLRQHSVPPDDAEDLAQEVMMVVARQLPAFAHSGRSGAFRHWLRSITLLEEKAYWRSRQLRGQPVGGTDFHQVLEQLEDEHSELSQLWDEQHDRHVLQELLRQAAAEFEPKTMQAFRRLALDGVPAQQVADELGMSVGAVYVAKSRVVRRLRSEALELVADGRLS